MNHYGSCNSYSNQWTAQYDQKEIGKAPAPVDLSHSRIYWGWNKPERSSSLNDHNYINWKFDKVLKPVYDFSYSMGPYAP